MEFQVRPADLVDESETMPRGRNSSTTRTAVIACGALARELLELKAKYGWDADVLALPALFHNDPGRITAAVQERIHAAR